MHRSDPQLIQRCIDGEQTGWNELVEKYARLVYSIPRRYGLSDADAEDVFQTVFSTVVRTLPKLRDQRRLSAWLITTTRRECWRKSKATRTNVEVTNDLADGGASPDEEIGRLERQQMVREALQQLDGRDRELLEALFMRAEAASYEQLARELDIPLGSIGPTRARAFRKLEAILREMGAEDAA